MYFQQCTLNSPSICKNASGQDPPRSWLCRKAAVGVAGCPSSCLGSCRWLPPPFCNFHSALTFRLHSANTAHHLCLGAYMKDAYPAPHLPLLWRWTSVPADPRSEPPPLLQWHYAICTVSSGLCCFLQSGLPGLPHTPSVKPACTMLSRPYGLYHCHLVASRTVANDYVTSP